MSPITRTLDDALHVVICTWDGAITDAEMIAAYGALYADRRWRPGFNEVTDLRRADLHGITADGLRGVRVIVAAAVDGFTGSFRTAILAPTDLSFGLSRMYEMMSADSNESVRVCRDVADAASWVGIPAKSLAP